VVGSSTWKEVCGVWCGIWGLKIPNVEIYIYIWQAAVSFGHRCVVCERCKIIEATS
jgi:hypothetical protein